MKKLRWQFVIILLTGLVVGILLVTQQQTTGGDNPADPEPTEGGVYTEGLTGSLQRLNPLLDANNQVDQDVDSLIFSGLVRFDSRGAAQPDLAELWKISEDGTTYNFAIRQNANWHDGEPVTAEDIVFTIDLMRADDSTVSSDLREFWKEVEVSALEEKIVQFRLPEAFAPFLDYLAFGVLPKHLLEGISAGELIDADFNLQPVGSGPYRFDHLMIDGDQITGLVLSANPDYYIKAPFIEEIVFRYYQDSAAVLNAYEQGEVQGIGEVTGDILEEALEQPELSFYSGRKPELSMILLNLNNDDLSFFQDKDIRRALMLGLNRQWMIDHLLDGQAVIANGPIFPSTWAYYDGLETTPYDPDQALEIIKDAGYVLAEETSTIREKDGTKFSFTLICPDGQKYLEQADAIRDDWQKLGIEVNVESMTYEELIEDHLETRDFQAALVDLNLTSSPDPDPYPFWDQAQTSSGQNYSQWDDRNASEYLERARITLDQEERTKLYGNFQIIFADELPALPLYYPVYNYAIDTEVQGVQMGPLVKPGDRFLTITDWYLVSRRGESDQAAEVTTTPSP